MKELVSALHGLILLYEKQFQIAALRNTEVERTGVNNVSTSLTPTGWIHVSIDPAELEASFESETKSEMKNINLHTSRHSIKSHSPPFTSPSSSVSSEEHFMDSLPGKSPSSNFVPSSSPLSLNSISGKNFYTHVWKSMIFLASDPNPSVAHMAQHVVHSLHDKVSACCLMSCFMQCPPLPLQLRQKSHSRNIGVTHATTFNSSSPSKDGPTLKSATLGPSSLRYNARHAIPPLSQDVRGHSLVSITQGHVAGSSLPLGRKRSGGYDETEKEEDFESTQDLQPLPTDFCDWCCKYFANPLTKVYTCLTIDH